MALMGDVIVVCSHGEIRFHQGGGLQGVIEAVGQRLRGRFLHRAEVVSIAVSNGHCYRRFCCQLWSSFEVGRYKALLFTTLAGSNRKVTYALIGLQLF